MDLEKRFKLYEDRYKHELDSREKIHSRSNPLLAFFGIVFAIFGFLCKETILANKIEFDFTYLVMLSAAVLSFIIAIIFFIRTLIGYEYLLIPTPEELEDYLEKTIAEYSKANPSKAKGWAKEVFEEYLFESYIKYTSHNTKNNDTKSLNLDRALKCLIFSFLTACIAYLPYYKNLNTLSESNNVAKAAAAAATAAASSKRPASSSSFSSTNSSSRGAP